MTEEYPKARQAVGKRTSWLLTAIHWPGEVWCKRKGHPPKFLKWSRFIKSDGSDTMSFRSCRLCGNVYEQDTLTILAILEREINEMENV